MDLKLEHLGSPKDPFGRFGPPSEADLPHFEGPMSTKNWREFRPCTLVLLLQFWPQSTQQD